MTPWTGAHALYAGELDSFLSSVLSGVNAQAMAGNMLPTPLGMSHHPPLEKLLTTTK